MPLKNREIIEEPHLNLTPMIDIVFLLIIFFMVGTQFTEKERHYDIELPTVSEAQPLTSVPDELIVNVLRDGTITLGDQVRTLDALESELRSAQRNYPDQSVIVRGDAAGPYQHIMDVLAACHRANIHRISLANRLEAKDR